MGLYVRFETCYDKYLCSSSMYKHNYQYCHPWLIQSNVDKVAIFGSEALYLIFRSYYPACFFLFEA